MSKVKYLFNRIKSMDYSKMFETVDFVHEKNGKNKFIILLDIIYCGLKYQAGYMDYKIFEMYNLNKKQRKTIITRGINNELVKKYNNPDYIKFFRNKIEFNKKFNKYLLREWLCLKDTEEGYKEFKDFCEKHHSIIVKPIDECCGKGVEKLEVDKKNIKEIYNNLISTNRILVEEVATQCKEISKLHPSSINTIRMVTLKGEIVAAFLRIGNNNNVVDNFNHGGLVAPINIETGIIDYLAIDKAGNIYEKHPLTNESILWFKIPKWPRIKRYIKQACNEVPEIGYIAWDVSLGEKGPFLIESNEFPGHDLYQLPPHRTNGIGLLPRFEKVLNDYNRNSIEKENN